MGRRSINTTKSGKYMNPADQARKEARKKELKKNKKHRQMVREAVLKNKDLSQILEEMEKIDEMEYNVLQPSPLNEKVLRDKRKKLKDTFDRVMRFYHNDDPELWSELKRKEVEYEKKRLKKQQYYESVKHAQNVQIDEIPLPSSFLPPPTALSLSTFAPGAPLGALKKYNENHSKLSFEKTDEIKKEETLGVPVGPPPDLTDFSDLDSDAEDDEVVLKTYVPISKQSKVVPKPNSLQERMAISGQNIDDFMKEMENVHKKKVAAGRLGDNAGKTADDSDKKTKTSDVEDGGDDDDEDGDKTNTSNSTDNTDDKQVSDSSRRKRKNLSSGKITAELVQAAPMTVAPMTAAPMPMNLPYMQTQSHMYVSGPPVPTMGGLAPPPIMFRPSPRPPGMHAFGIRIPPGPPPGPRPGMPRMVPGPPPGMPPHMSHHKNQQLQNKDSKGVTTITAKPQIRNLIAAVTRFVPSSLRVKRDDARKPNLSKPYAQKTSRHLKESNHAASKDDAYTQFMNEMQGLL